MTTVEKIRELQNWGYVFHHTAYASGYVSRKTHGYLVKYEGRFGRVTNGFIRTQKVLNIAM